MFNAWAVMNELQLAIIFLSTAIASSLFKFNTQGVTPYCTRINLGDAKPVFLLTEVAEQLLRSKWGTFFKR